MFIMYLDYANKLKGDYRSLKGGLMSGSLCPESLVRKVESELGIKDIIVC